MANAVRRELDFYLVDKDAAAVARLSACQAS
jgi:hypothetical protein